MRLGNDNSMPSKFHVGKYLDVLHLAFNDYFLAFNDC